MSVDLHQQLPEIMKLTPKCQMGIYRIRREVFSGQITHEMAKLRIDLLLTNQKVNQQRTEEDLDKIEKFLFHWLDCRG